MSGGSGGFRALRLAAIRGQKMLRQFQCSVASLRLDSLPSRKACGFDHEVDERSGDEVACFGRLRFMGASSRIYSAENC